MARETGENAKGLLETLAAATFSRVADAGRDTGNAVRILRDGTENFPIWLDAINKAERTVHFENYIFTDDVIGRKFADALKEAVKRGVRVRVIYDWMGCKGRASKRYWNDLIFAGVEVRCYNPFAIDSPLGWISRDHRK